MKSVKINKHTRELAADQDEYNNLFIRDTQIDGHPVMQSEWKPGAIELDKLNQGGSIVLAILGHIHPPVMLEVSGVDPAKCCAQWENAQDSQTDCERIGAAIRDWGLSGWGICGTGAPVKFCPWCGAAK